MKLQIVGPIDDSMVRRIGELNSDVMIRTGASSPDETPCDVLLAWETTVDELVAALRGHRSLPWVHTNAAGIHPLVIDALAEQPTILTNGSGAQAPAIAEYVVAALLAFRKRLRELGRFQDQAQWAVGFRVAELRDLTVGIVGLGNAGRAIARLLRPFGVRLLGVRRHPAPVEEVDRVYSLDELPEFLAQLDALVIAAPLTSETRGIIGAKELARLRPGAVLVNVARGAIVDEDALIAALHTGQLAGAALDVFGEEPLLASSPLWAMPNVIVSPHCCDHTPETDERGLALFLDNLTRYVNGEPLRNVVDRDVGY
jgi:phosphoglycerate dehydrogenase-like enzyme